MLLLRTSRSSKHKSLLDHKSLVRRTPLIAIVLIVFSNHAYSQTPTPTTTPTPGEEQINLGTLEPAEAIRGEGVTVSGTFPKKPVEITVELRSVQSGPPVRVLSENVSIVEDGQTFTFAIPNSARLGKYEVFVTFTKGGKKYGPVMAHVSEGSTFSITTGEPVKVDSVYPEVSYPDKGTFGFKIIGEGFSPIKEDNALIIKGRGAVPLCDTPGANQPCVNEEILDRGREIRFSGLALADFQGVQSIQLRVGNQYSEKPVSVTLSQVSRKTPALIALGVIVLTIVIIGFFLRGTSRTTSGEQRVNLMQAIFLDRETNTYSLSKLQFYLWTLAALFGYVYLSVSRSLVQGKIEFADIPENLPGILLVAVSTSAVAIGITSGKGSKGAGERNPSLADFVTTGGLVAAERVQFIVWTFVGVSAFLFLTLSTEPGRIENLPSVPERFLYLMGISSFGYLGGKLARKPGPVIRQMEAEQGSLTLTAHGSNLSPDATFRIDEQDLNPKILDEGVHPEGRPEIVTKDDQPGFAKILRLKIAQPVTEWLKEGEHIFTITNPDGQKAESVFTFSSQDSEQPTNGSPNVVDPAIPNGSAGASVNNGTVPD
jgi:hypothetical protein